MVVGEFEGATKITKGQGSKKLVSHIFYSHLY